MEKLSKFSMFIQDYVAIPTVLSFILAIPSFVVLVRGSDALWIVNYFIASMAITALWWVSALLCAFVIDKHIEIAIQNKLDREFFEDYRWCDQSFEG